MFLVQRQATQIRLLQLVYSTHDRDLATSLFYVALVDIQSIDLEIAWMRFLFHLVEEMPQVLAYLDKSAVDRNGMKASIIAPYIRDCRIWNFSADCNVQELACYSVGLSAVFRRQLKDADVCADADRRWEVIMHLNA